MDAETDTKDEKKKVAITPITVTHPEKVEVDGNRFEIPRLDGLDKRSLGLVEQVL